jgi:hypothetical protein
MINPALSLDFTSATLDPRITFARSGATATRVNASGFIEAMAADTPRFDFNSITLACKGLLVEETRQNIFFPSNDFANIVWTPTQASIVSVANTDPEGNANSQKLVDTAVSSVHRIGILMSVTPNTYTVSLYAKAAEISCFTLIRSGSGLASARFNLATMTATNIADATALTMTTEKNGWVRCTMTWTSAVTITRTLFIQLEKPAGTSTYVGNGTDGLFLYGMQREIGAFATSYIPTTLAAVTRNADVATITGTNFSDFWQASKGGAQVQAIPSTVSGIRPLVQYDDGTADNIIALRGNTTNPELYIVDGGTPQVQLDAGTIAVNTPYSLTGWWQTNDCKARKDSGAVVTDTTATIPTVTQARIGSDGTNYLNGTIATINYYDSFFGRPIYTRRKNKVFPSLL